MRIYLLVGVAVATASLCACARREARPAAPETSFQETLQIKLLDAERGDVIEIPVGTFSFDRTLSLAVDGVTIRGKGMDKSILSFKGQVVGAEGLLVTADDFVIEDLAIEDTKGDALKVNGGENIVIRRVRAEWTGGPKTENGAYGIYPVQSKNVLIEGSVAIGASDAGLYVGQSQNVVMRGSRAERNVAGIEIENTFDADVYDNVATDNAGGILVFNMPNLERPGARTRVFRNKVVDNNRANFGAPGTPVSRIAAGSGVVVMANDQVEIFDNDITGHKTVNVIVGSAFSSGLSLEEMKEDYDPYPEAVFIYGNRMGGGGTDPDSPELQQLRAAMFGQGALPDVLWDGMIDPEKLVAGALPETLKLCVENEGAEILNLDSANESANARLGGAEHACALPKLPAVKLAGALAQ